MSTGYRLAYRLGLTPWEKASSGFGPQLDALLDKAAGDGPLGTAVDLGCGTGEHTVRLARRGWDAVGVDSVPLALTRARARAKDAGVSARFVQADVTALGPIEGVQLALDVGCFHGMTDPDRLALGRELTRVTLPGSVLLVFAFGPGRRGPLPRGASRSDVETALPGWELTSQEAADTSGMPAPLRRSAPQWFRFDRR